MKSPLRAFPGMILLAILVSVVSPGVGLAQPVTPRGQTPKVDPAKHAQDLAAYRTGLESAVTLAKANNVVGAEQALVALNKAKANTASWHIETAQRLMQAAERLARDARPTTIPALAASALQHLTQADTLAKDPRTRAAAKSLTGFIHERYLANRVAALGAYQAAVQLSPNSARAKEAVARMQQTDDNLRTRVPGGGR